MRILRHCPFRQVSLTLLIFGSVLRVSAQEAEPINIVVAATRMNTLYCGINNPLTVAVPGVSCEDLVVSVSSGTLTGSGCAYTVDPKCGPGRLSVKAQWKDGAVQRSATSEFRVKDLPVPVAFFGGRAADDESIRLLDAQAAKRIVARVMGLELDLHFNVVHFHLQIRRGAGTLYDGETNEAKLSEAMLNAMRSLVIGDLVRMSDIRATDATGRIFDLKPLRLEVGE
jgi:hypothetical protein